MSDSTPDHPNGRTVPFQDPSEGPRARRAAGLARTVVVIPALNEEDTLPGLLAALPEELGGVVVVDNGSTDRTPDIAREHGVTLVTELERGYGAACLAGIAAAGAMEVDVIAFLDADHELGPAQIGQLIEPITDDRADFTLGTRIPDPEHGGSVFVHARAGNNLVLTLVKLLFGHRYSDMAPFRAIRSSSLTALAMDDRNWGWTLQMQIRAARAGLRILEVPFVHRPRNAGESKISGSVVGTIRAGTKMFYTLARERLRS